MGSLPILAVMDNRAANSAIALAAENDFSALNYLSLPIVFARAQGAEVWDPEGKRYLDFHSASTALNHGHCHPKLVAAMIDQVQRLTLTSRAFHNDVYPMFAELVTKTFGYQRVLPSTTGAEAGETAIKVARKWAYKVKGTPIDQAIVQRLQVIQALRHPAGVPCRVDSGVWNPPAWAMQRAIICREDTPSCGQHMATEMQRTCSSIKGCS